ncbi:MAG TPA: helix-turn-helix transcriptional regulator [Spirochaetia bacterium]|jgi:DNA-binding Xre family transcriptional regulator|nr:helix-turn-helix transcriptional regulator [Spirochaetia bacterium]
MAKTMSYNKLWKMLIDKNMKRQGLKEISGISTASIANLGKGENITTAVLLKICNALDCDVSDIMEVTPDETAESADEKDEKEQ